MTVQPDDVVKVTCSFVYDEVSVMQNVFYYQNTGSSAVSDEDVLTDLVGEIDGYYGSLTSTWSSRMVPRDLVLYNITQDLPIGSSPWPTLEDGGSALESLPLQCAPLVSFLTGFAKAVGRKYLPAVDEAHNSHGGALAAPLLADMLAWAVGVLGGVTIDGQPFYAGHVSSVTGGFVRWLTSEVNTLIRSQRRRVIGVGE
jgi:hypothetical protein